MVIGIIYREKSMVMGSPQHYYSTFRIMESVHVICWKERIIKGLRDQDGQDTQRIDAYFDWRERGELNEGIFFRDSLKNYDKTKSH